MSVSTFGGDQDRFIGTVTTLYTDPPRVLIEPGLSYQPESQIDSIEFVIRRSDGASFTFTAQRRDRAGNLMRWDGGLDEEFLLLELFRRANEHHAEERKAES